MSVDKKEPKGISRRRFLGYLVAGIGTALGAEKILPTLNDRGEAPPATEVGPVRSEYWYLKDPVHLITEIAEKIPDDTQDEYEKFFLRKFKTGENAQYTLEIISRAYADFGEDLVDTVSVVRMAELERFFTMMERLWRPFYTLHEALKAKEIDRTQYLSRLMEFDTSIDPLLNWINNIYVGPHSYEEQRRSLLPTENQVDRLMKKQEILYRIAMRISRNPVQDGAREGDGNSPMRVVSQRDLDVIRATLETIDAFFPLALVNVQDIVFRDPLHWTSYRSNADTSNSRANLLAPNDLAESLYIRQEEPDAEVPTYESDGDLWALDDMLVLLLHEIVGHFYDTDNPSSNTFMSLHPKDVVAYCKSYAEYETDILNILDGAAEQSMVATDFVALYVSDNLPIIGTDELPSVVERDSCVIELDVLINTLAEIEGNVSSLLINQVGMGEIFDPNSEYSLFPIKMFGELPDDEYLSHSDVLEKIRSQLGTSAFFDKSLNSDHVRAFKTILTDHPELWRDPDVARCLLKLKSWYILVTQALLAKVRDKLQPEFFFSLNNGSLQYYLDSLTTSVVGACAHWVVGPYGEYIPEPGYYFDNPTLSLSPEGLYTHSRELRGKFVDAWLTQLNAHLPPNKQLNFERAGAFVDCIWDMQMQMYVNHGILEGMDLGAGFNSSVRGDTLGQQIMANFPLISMYAADNNKIRIDAAVG
ncbi:MAG TPA: hypothetical protein VLH19_03805 [Patescibacteria group bacterium]|nr:hypothetical protein [Patescibacteria group bacterium]